VALTAEQVRHVAALARLALSDDEVERYRAQLSAILEAASALDAVDTSGVEPTGHPRFETSPLREDAVHEPLGAQGPFTVPRVIDPP
jgi:aspartyl-tRNA(Asn)/glutamyl-tRNA(Gln) amidotransferase subunit C